MNEQNIQIYFVEFSMAPGLSFYIQAESPFTNIQQKLLTINMHLSNAPILLSSTYVAAIAEYQVRFIQPTS